MTFESRPGYLHSFKITRTAHFVWFLPCFKPGCLVVCCSSFYFHSCLSTHCPSSAVWWFGVKWFTPGCLSTGISAPSPQWLTAHTGSALKNSFHKLTFFWPLPTGRRYRPTKTHSTTLLNNLSPRAASSLRPALTMCGNLAVNTVHSVQYHWWWDNKHCVLVWEYFISSRFSINLLSCYLSLLVVVFFLFIGFEGAYNWVN